MTAIIDYGLGNICAFTNVFRRLQLPLLVARSAQEISQADRLILPGVGAFDWAMERLTKSGMLPAIEDKVLLAGTPILGVCVGMQILGQGSEEGEAPGLGWINGTVRRLQVLPGNERLQLPHMGWNTVEPRPGSSLFKSLGVARFYFLHSYYFDPASEENTAGVTAYGMEFSSAVVRKNIYGVQFHPEKSHRWGSELLRNFAAL